MGALMSSSIGGFCFSHVVGFKLRGFDDSCFVHTWTMAFEDGGQRWREAGREYSLPPILMLTLTHDRRLRPDARSVQNAADERGLCSMADSRLAVYEDVNLATEFR